jgi:hypothetical protein
MRVRQEIRRKDGRLMGANARSTAGHGAMLQPRSHQVLIRFG